MWPELLSKKTVALFLGNPVREKWYLNILPNYSLLKCAGILQLWKFLLQIVFYLLITITYLLIMKTGNNHKYNSLIKSWQIYFPYWYQLLLFNSTLTRLNHELAIVFVWLNWLWGWNPTPPFPQSRGSKGQLEKVRCS